MPGDIMARQGKSREAVAYLRTSSAANIGADKDSDRRQREAIQGFARRAGIEVVDEFYDPAVGGGDPVESRPGFIAMLKAQAAEGRAAVLSPDRGGAVPGGLSERERAGLLSLV